MRNSKSLTKEEYNEPVYYCRSCHSLYVIGDDDCCDGGISYCGKCGSTNIGECAFGIWLEVEETKERKRREREWNK